MPRKKKLGKLVLLPQPGPNEELIDLLEGLLEDARSGELDGLFCVQLLRDGSHVFDWSNGAKMTYFQTVGMLHGLAHDYQAQSREEAPASELET